jgi:acyl-coenzyme A synthetase/AMP-(fatty) acid ligase
MIFRFALLQDKTIKGSPGEKRISSYCRKVTVIWCAFFILNEAAAAFTIFFGSDFVWSIYNGGISYILMGILFACEYLVRIRVQKTIPKAVPLSAVNKKSRGNDAVICYEDTWKSGVYKTWGDFLKETAAFRAYIASEPSSRFILHCEDCWLFLVAFASLLQCKKEIILTANASTENINEIDAPFLADQTIQEKCGIQTDDLEELPSINADETSIIMLTSGSTGKPKEVKQRLTEFENDNRFVISKWGDEFLSRKLCSTVSQHHIYGLLFSILLPFTCGVPFRRRRIEIPEEFEKLTDTEYMIISVPAFLKRAVEIESKGSLKLLDPWIFTSGGLLSYETAEKTSEVFGFWPVEVYGSTETSGIAWRQSKNGQEWAPFDNAQLSVNGDGCLIIRSPYIKDPDGFETADMVELLEDGRFLLKGRIDFVVKIEEKRISLVEVQQRILQSGLVSASCVIPMEGKRQYLAAAVVLNDKGKEKFENFKKHDINQYFREYLSQYFERLVIPKKWRYPESLPSDIQGKIKREEVINLFTDNKFILDKVVEKDENSVTLELTLPPGSPYFDGHFPSFRLLPAVGQTEIVLRLANEYLDTGINASQLRRFKFTNFILPSYTVRVKLEKKENNLSFRITTLEGEACSNGNIIL